MTALHSRDRQRRIESGPGNLGIEVRNLADFDGDRHAGGRQTVHLIVLDDFGQRQSELACAVIAQEVAHGAFRSDIEADALQGLHGQRRCGIRSPRHAVTSHSRYASKCSSKCNCKNRSFSEQHDWPSYSSNGAGRLEVDQ